MRSSISHRRWLPTAALVVVGALLVSACSSSGEASSAGGGTPQSQAVPTGVAPHPLPQKTVVTIGIAQPAEAYDQAYLAQAFGEFAKENLEVKFETVAPTSMLVLLQQGKIDMTILGAQAGIFNAIHAGAQVRYIAGAGVDDGSGYFLSPKTLSKNPNFGPCDLKDKTVSIGPGGAAGVGTFSAVPLASYLKKCNLTLHDIKPAAVAGPDLLVALKTGSVELGSEFTTLAHQASALGYKKLISFPAVPFAPWVAGSALLKKPLVEAALLRAMVRTTRTYLQGDFHKNPKVLTAIAKAIGQSTEFVSKTVPVKFNPDMTFNPDILVNDTQSAWMTYGGLLNYKEPLTVPQLVDTSVLTKVTS